MVTMSLWSAIGQELPGADTGFRKGGGGGGFRVTVKY